MIYRRFSIVSRITAIVGVVAIALLCGLILLDGEDLSTLTIWLLLLAVFIAAPMEVFGLLLSFLKEKTGYKLSLGFGVPLLAVAIWLVFASTKNVFFETQGFDAVRAVMTGIFGLLLLSPFALIAASYILSNSKNQKIVKLSAGVAIFILLYLLLLLSLFLVNIITLAGE